ncbi:MAG: GxxExxY protein [Actinobacteria bacterium]|nr:GxxExxY protein [Actinomycetota bacterium]
MDKDYKHSDLTNLIIKAFYKVYNTLGYGFREKVYANALAIELRKMGIEAIREAEINVYYEGEIAGEFYADLLIGQKVIVETKAKRELVEDHEAQLLSYLKSTIHEVGLLLNYGPEPEIKRKVYDNSRKGSLSWIKQ